MTTKTCLFNNTSKDNFGKLSSEQLLKRFLFLRSLIIIVSLILLFTLQIYLYYYFCDHERKVTFDENVESALDEMARYDAKQRIKNRKTNKKKPQHRQPAI